MLVRMRRRGLGGGPAYGNSDAWHAAYLAAKNGPAVDWFPPNAESNAMYLLKRDYSVYQNMADDGEPPNWTQVTDNYWHVSEDQKAALQVRMGMPVDQLSASQTTQIDPKTGKLISVTDPTKVAALDHMASTDAWVQSMAATSNAGNPLTADQQRKIAADRAADAAAQKAYNDAMIAWYAAGHTGPFPGVGASGGVSVGGGGGSGGGGGLTPTGPDQSFVDANPGHTGGPDVNYVPSRETVTAAVDDDGGMSSGVVVTALAIGAWLYVVRRKGR